MLLLGEKRQGAHVRDRSFLVVASVLALLGIIVGGGYLYDHSRNDLIAKGVTVGGVDVGGMRAADARKALRSELRTRVSQPVIAAGLNRRFALRASAAHVQVDVNAMVDEAVARSRRGSIISRIGRALGGNHVDAALPIRAQFSGGAVKHWVKGVSARLDRKPANASLSYSAAGISTVRGRRGVAIDAPRLLRDVEDTLTVQPAKRTVAIDSRAINPKVTTADLSRLYPAVIVINRSAFQLKLFQHLQLSKTYTIAVGRQGLETPAGLYDVQDKQVNPSWHVPNSAWAGALAGRVIPPGPQDPIKARWIGFNGGAGMHGTADVGSLGTAASHGCIRMAIPDVIDLYDRVNVGDPVYVA
jgi:lipoprotein-anchoring transpeptidase ErfK/SrfK